MIRQKIQSRLLMSKFDSKQQLFETNILHTGPVVMVAQKINIAKCVLQFDCV